MRAAVALLAAFLVLSGCAGKSDPTATATDGTTSAPGTSASTTPASGTSGAGPASTGPASANHAPVGGLAASVGAGKAPLRVNFTLAGSDADNDTLSYTLRFGDNQTASGAGPFPATVGHTYAVAGTFRANYTLSDGKASVSYTVRINVTSGVVEAAETYFLHSTAPGENSMDHTPAEGSEEGSGTAAVVQPADGFKESFPASDATRSAHAKGNLITVHFFATTASPSPGTKVTATLQLAGAVIGTGSDTQMTTTVFDPSGVAPDSGCVEWTINFATTAAIPAGVKPTLDVTADYPGHFFPCYMGGEETSRMVLA